MTQSSLSRLARCSNVMRQISPKISEIGTSLLLVLSATQFVVADVRWLLECIQAYAEGVGTECTQEAVEQLELSKAQCDQRHMDSVEQCKAIAATNLPRLLSREEMVRAMLRFVLCRGMVMQGNDFDLTAWEPTITQMLEKSHEEE